MDINSLKGERMILLTGATGFLGSNLLRKLVCENYKVICTRRTSSKFDRVKDVYDKCMWFNTDIYDIEELFKKYDIDILIHCAATFGRRENEYFQVYESNLVFPLRLFEKAQKYECKYFMNTSTFFVKEIQNVKNINEKIYLDAYVKSKYFFSNIIKDGIENSNIAFLNLQLEHMYGAGNGAGKFVEYVIRSLKSNVQYLELTEGLQTRDWVYIDDVISAYLTILHNLEKYEEGQFYDFEVGTGIEISVKTFVQEIKKMTHSSTELQFGKIEMHKNELIASHADNRTLCDLGWKPVYDISKGIEKMINGEENEDNYSGDSDL